MTLPMTFPGRNLETLKARPCSLVHSQGQNFHSVYPNSSIHAHTSRQDANENEGKHTLYDPAHGTIRKRQDSRGSG